MWKNRLAFALLYAALLVLLLLFSKPFLLAALIVLVVLAALMALLTRRDARLLRTSVRVKSGWAGRRNRADDVHVCAETAAVGGTEHSGRGGIPQRYVRRERA